MDDVKIKEFEIRKLSQDGDQLLRAERTLELSGIYDGEEYRVRCHVSERIADDIHNPQVKLELGRYFKRTIAADIKGKE